MLMAGPAVGDDDRREVADQLVELLAVAVRGDLKRRRVGRGQSRQRSRVARGAPAGLVDVQRLLGTDPVAQVGIRARQRIACWQIASTLPAQTAAPNSSR